MHLFVKTVDLTNQLVVDREAISFKSQNFFTEKYRLTTPWDLITVNLLINFSRTLFVN